MEAAQIHVRRLAPTDSAIYRDIRLEALQCHPEAYGSTFEAENAEPLSWFSNRLEGSKVFGAFHGSELIGIAGLVIRGRRKEAHKGLLVGMYVRPGSRKAGVGQRLVETIIEFAQGEIELIQLAVISENEQARRLYNRLGFVAYGIEKKALKQGSRYYDEVLMAKDLTPDL